MGMSELQLPMFHQNDVKHIEFWGWDLESKFVISLLRSEVLKSANLDFHCPNVGTLSRLSYWTHFICHRECRVSEKCVQ